MLILTRRTGETINIGENIQVTVLRIDRNYVRIGVEAPKSVPVHRAERVINTRQDKESD
jgi:carbon storage regulator